MYLYGNCDPMKKIILGFLLVLFALNLSAQPSERHEISVFYGHLSNTDIYGYGLEQLANLIAGATKGNKVRVAGQASLLGMEFGKRFCGFLDLGLGDLGVASAGLRVKF